MEPVCCGGFPLGFPSKPHKKGILKKDKLGLVKKGSPFLKTTPHLKIGEPPYFWWVFFLFLRFSFHSPPKRGVPTPKKTSHIEASEHLVDGLDPFSAGPRRTTTCQVGGRPNCPAVRRLRGCVHMDLWTVFGKGIKAWWLPAIPLDSSLFRV